jgi:REP element-mobilizing transposase RayT
MTQPNRSNPIWTCRGYLPHLVVPGCRQFITFNLADALPRHVAARLAVVESPADDEARRIEFLTTIHRTLDDGAGSCLLRDPRLAGLVENALLHFDGTRYDLLAWVVMPNHVHAAVALRPSYRVTEVVRSWKSFTAKQANEILGRSGTFWRKDFFDVRIRDEEHLGRVRRYIERNPVAAGLCARPEDWPFGSAARRLRRSGEQSP